MNGESRQKWPKMADFLQIRWYFRCWQRNPGRGFGPRRSSVV